MAELSCVIAHTSSALPVGVVAAHPPLCRYGTLMKAVQQLSATQPCHEEISRDFWPPPYDVEVRTGHTDDGSCYAH